MNDFLDILTNNFVIFADYLKIFNTASCRNDYLTLQNILNVLFDFYQKNTLVLNINKCTRKMYF